MSLDLVIKGGSLVDGTGAAAFSADIGIKDGQIVEIGRVTTPARETLNADGALVTPGFIDIHTHYDGQTSWDPDMTPSSSYGVTTAVMGNCGVGFAPCRPADRDRLIKLMEGVEDIPGTALYEGITWAWETFPEYMDAVDAIPRTIDVGLQIPHNPLRLWVMGERAIQREPATPDDIAQMQKLAVQGIEAGALGFSSANTVNHRDVDGNPTYARLVAASELFAIGEAIGRTGKGVLQILNDFYQETAQDLPTLIEWSRRSKRPLSFTLEQDDFANTNFWHDALGAIAQAAAEGVQIRPQVAARNVGTIFSLGSTLNPLINRQSMYDIHHLPVPEKVRIMRDPAFKARVLAEPPMLIADKFTSVTPRIDDAFTHIQSGRKQLFVLDDTVDYEQPKERSIWAEAQRQQRDIFDLIYDILLEDEGRGLIFSPTMNYAGFNFDAVLAMLNYPDAILGLGDAGAHVKYISDASFNTYILSYWTRDRTRGPRLSVERAVQLQTSQPAKHLNLQDRGVLAIGKRADINVIDMARLRIGKPVLVSDLPGGSDRYLQAAEGYVATYVHGQKILANDKLTGARPGRLVRGQ